MNDRGINPPMPGACRKQIEESEAEGEGGSASRPPSSVAVPSGVRGVTLHHALGRHGSALGAALAPAR